MFIYIESLLIILLEILCGKIFFEAFTDKREEIKKWIENLLFFLLVIGSFFNAIIFQQMILVKTIIVILGIALTMRCIYNTTLQLFHKKMSYRTF